MFTDEDLDHLRELIIEFKIRECHKWNVVEDRLGVSQHKIKKFIEAEAKYIPPATDIRSIYEAFDTFIRENPRSRLLSVCGGQIDALFRVKEETDKYRSFKDLVSISDDEQSSFSQEISGCFLAFRKHKDGGFFVSHVRVIDSHRKRGLPICRVSRKLSEGGDLIIDGSVFKKNNRVYIIGYERGSGDVRSIQLLPFDENYGLLKGFVSGFETTGEAFVSRILVGRVSVTNNYGSVREKTGLVPDIEEVFSTIGMLSNDAERLIESMASFNSSDAYSTVSIGV